MEKLLSTVTACFEICSSISRQKILSVSSRPYMSVKMEDTQSQMIRRHYKDATLNSLDRKYFLSMRETCHLSLPGRASYFVRASAELPSHPFSFTLNVLIFYTLLRRRAGSRIRPRDHDESRLSACKL